MLYKNKNHSMKINTNIHRHFDGIKYKKPAKLLVFSRAFEENWNCQH